MASKAIAGFDTKKLDGMAVTATDIPGDKRGLDVTINEGLLSGVTYDAINATYPTATNEIFTYKLNGSIVAIVTLVYTDSTKENISSVTRS